MSSDAKLIDETLLDKSCINNDVFNLYYIDNCAYQVKCMFDV